MANDKVWLLENRDISKDFQNMFKYFTNVLLKSLKKSPILCIEILFEKFTPTLTYLETGEIIDSSYLIGQK